MAGRRCPWARLLLFYSFILLLFKISLSLLSVTPVVTAEFIVFWFEIPTEIFCDFHRIIVVDT